MDEYLETISRFSRVKAYGSEAKWYNILMAIYATMLKLNGIYPTRTPEQICKLALIVVENLECVTDPTETIRCYYNDDLLQDVSQCNTIEEMYQADIAINWEHRYNRPIKIFGIIFPKATLKLDISYTVWPTYVMHALGDGVKIWILRYYGFLKVSAL